MTDGSDKLGRPLLLLLLLAAAWLLWSGLFKPLLLGLGLFSCLLTVYLARRMRFFETELFALHFNRRLAGYWLWLTREIVRSSIDVTRIVLHPRLPISPTVVELDAAPPDPVGQAILGNSITLTPGTLTLDLYRGTLKIHCLTESGARDLAGGEMNRRVAALTRD
jgi:multicomponent Na+:H+ antiporter subunit E